MEVRCDPEFFGEAELDLLYMARRLREALKLEALLTEAGLDYLVETGTYTGGFLMRRDLAGAFFYVAPADLTRARELLLKNRYRPYENKN
ncbi:MAG: hypothetical protein ACR2JB_27600 [Bryobacteraceae bacterium]